MRSRRDSHDAFHFKMIFLTTPSKLGCRQGDCLGGCRWREVETWKMCAVRFGHQEVQSVPGVSPGPEVLSQSPLFLVCLI